MSISFHKVASLPGSPAADSFYFVENGAYSESYITDDAGVAKMIGNSAMINTLIAAEIAALDAGIIQDVADIAARDALTLTKNGMVMVYDASADASVVSGAAMYYYDQSADTFTKVSEFESLDFTFNWANLVDKPASSVAAIDAAVSQSHSHSNKTELDKIGESGGLMTYSGAALVAAVDWSTNNW